MASVGIFTPDLLIYSFPEMTATDEHMKYPFCLVYTTNLYLYHMFHLLSLVLTTIMCFQKTCVIMFPIWGKQHLWNRFSFTSVVVVFVCSVVVYLPRVLSYTFLVFCRIPSSCSGETYISTHRTRWYMLFQVWQNLYKIYRNIFLGRHRSICQLNNNNGDLCDIYIL